MESCSVIDIFCGVGGMTHGFVLEDFSVVAGIDTDASCQYAFEHNNKSKFISKDIQQVTAQELRDLYPAGSTKILIGCAPCQDFSKYAQKSAARKQEQEEQQAGEREQLKLGRWHLLSKFAQLIQEVEPDIVSMENVAELVTFQGGKVFGDFHATLLAAGYKVHYEIVYCPDYGIPQQRSRLVLLASKHGPIALIPKTHGPDTYRTVKDTIGALPRLTAGGENKDDPLHRASDLKPQNLKRIRKSVPGGTWLDWPKKLRAKCHKAESGRSYASVYGRMRWDTPSPTITTQYYGYGSGRFGHPEQDRALSLREGALLQTFPMTYEFVTPGDPIYTKTVGRQVGNAVPVELGRVIARSIRRHLEAHSG